MGERGRSGDSEGVEALVKRLKGNRILDRSLSANAATTRVMMAGAVLTVPLMLGVGVTLMEAAPTLAIALMTGLFVLGIGGTTALSMSMARRARVAQLLWLRELPFALDRERYLKLLSGKRKRSRARLEVVFREDVPEATRETMIDATRRVTGVKQARFVDGRLQARSEALTTWIVPRGDRKSFYSNAAVHRWVRALVDDAVLSLHERRPVERVIITVD